MDAIDEIIERQSPSLSRFKKKSLTATFKKLLENSQIKNREKPTRVTQDLQLESLDEIISHYVKRIADNKRFDSIFSLDFLYADANKAKPFALTKQYIDLFLSDEQTIPRQIYAITPGIKSLILWYDILDGVQNSFFESTNLFFDAYDIGSLSPLVQRNLNPLEHLHLNQIQRQHLLQTCQELEGIVEELHYPLLHLHSQTQKKWWTDQNDNPPQNIRKKSQLNATSNYYLTQYHRFMQEVAERINWPSSFDTKEMAYWVSNMQQVAQESKYSKAESEKLKKTLLSKKMFTVNFIDVNEYQAIKMARRASVFLTCEYYGDEFQQVLSALSNPFILFFGGQVLENKGLGQCSLTKQILRSLYVLANHASPSKQVVLAPLIERNPTTMIDHGIRCKDTLLYIDKNLIESELHVQEILGFGQNARVYKGQSPISNQEFAIKLLPLKVKGVDEARVQAMLKTDHPNITKLVSASNSQVTYDKVKLTSIITEYIKGNTIANLVKEQTLDDDQILTAATQLTSAIKYLYDNGIWHKDITDNNVMREDETGLYKVLDFGLAIIEKPKDYHNLRFGGKTDFESIAKLMQYMKTGEVPAQLQPVFDSQQLNDLMHALTTFEIDQDPNPLFTQTVQTYQDNNQQPRPKTLWQQHQQTPYWLAYLTKPSERFEQ